MQETQEIWVWSLGQEISWKKKWQPTPVFLPGKSHESSLVGYSPWICKELDTTERLSIHAHSLVYRPGCCEAIILITLSSFHLLSRVQLFVTPWTAACQASLSITNSQRLLKLMAITSVMPSNHCLLCHPFLLLPSIFPSIRVFSSESVLRLRWPKCWSFSFSIIPSNRIFRIDFL